jgi:hypothetical protein
MEGSNLVCVNAKRSQRSSQTFALIDSLFAYPNLPQVYIRPLIQSTTANPHLLIDGAPIPYIRVHLKQASFPEANWILNVSIAYSAE